MKQHITEKQLNELNEAELDELSYWLDKNNDVCPIPHIKDVCDEQMLLSIGQMIEFLNEKDSKELGFIMKFRCIESGPPMGETVDGFDVDELCDALWEAVKEVLIKEL